MQIKSEKLLCYSVAHDWYRYFRIRNAMFLCSFVRYRRSTWEADDIDGMERLFSMVTVKSMLILFRQKGSRFMA